MITIIDYGMGNVGSIRNMLKRIGVPSELCSDVEGIKKANKLILPGVGSFDNAVRHLQDSGMWSIIDQKVSGEKVPILGICLGMQLLCKSSDEGELAGFGWIDAHVTKFKKDENTTMKIPHMGWNLVKPVDTRLYSGLADEEIRFYFVHSYYVPSHQAYNAGVTTYGIEFASAIQNNNVQGVQFHPEKSHSFGMKLLANFAKTDFTDA